MLFITDSIPAVTATKDDDARISIKNIDSSTVSLMMKDGYICTIKDEDTRLIVGNFLQCKELNAPIKLQPRINEDTIIVVSLIGDIPEGTTTLPVSATIKFSQMKSELAREGFLTSFIKRVL